MPHSLSSHNTRLARNTLMLYLRMLLMMCINLYASRVILRVLGFDDYGLFNVVAGVVTMLGFLNPTLASGTQRFLNYAMGQDDECQLHKCFSNAMTIHAALALALVILAETVGLWFVRTQLAIPAGRDIAVFWIYQFSIVTLLFDILLLPYMSAIIAHEKMDIYAYVSILDACLKLLILFLISHTPYDKLILYGALYGVAHIASALVYAVYATSRFKEARLAFGSDKATIKEMLSFSGWSVMGGVASAANNQGVNVILNLFFGTVVNSARALSMQVYGMLYQLIANFQTALRPQVVKYYAAGQVREMTELVFNSAKASAFLMLLVDVPVMVEARELLRLWLVEYPDYTVSFLNVLLLIPLVAPLTGTVMMVVHATGKLKESTVWAGINQLLVLPVSYLLLKLGCSPVSSFIVMGLANLLECFIYLYWMNRHIDFPMWSFFREVFVPVVALFVLNYGIAYGIHSALRGLDPTVRMVVVGIVSVMACGATIYWIGCDKVMRAKAKSFLVSFFKER